MEAWCRMQPPNSVVITLYIWKCGDVTRFSQFSPASPTCVFYFLCLYWIIWGIYNSVKETFTFWWTDQNLAVLLIVKCTFLTRPYYCHIELVIGEKYSVHKTREEPWSLLSYIFLAAILAVWHVYLVPRPVPVSIFSIFYGRETCLAVCFALFLCGQNVSGNWKKTHI